MPTVASRDGWILLVASTTFEQSESCLHWGKQLNFITFIRLIHELLSHAIHTQWLLSITT